jgi:hypothetical protein
MPYTYASLAFVWLITLGLFAVTASGAVAGAGLLLFVLVALATPALVLRRSEHSAAAAPQLAPLRVVARPAVHSRRSSRTTGGASADLSGRLSDAGDERPLGARRADGALLKSGN